MPELLDDEHRGRKTKSPRFRWQRLPRRVRIARHRRGRGDPYRTDHRQGWVDLAGLLDGPTLRDIIGYSQNSIRRIEWHKFASAVEAAAGPTALTPVSIAQPRNLSGEDETWSTSTTSWPTSSRSATLPPCSESTYSHKRAPRRAMEGRGYRPLHASRHLRSRATFFDELVLTTSATAVGITAIVAVATAEIKTAVFDEP